MNRLHLSAAARTIYDTLPTPLAIELVISVSDDAGNAIKGLGTGSFSVTDMQFLGLPAPNPSGLSIQSVTEVGGASSFYLVICPLSITQYAGNHILMVSATQVELVRAGLPRPTTVAQGFVVVTIAAGG
jgi:hypothetical protein